MRIVVITQNEAFFTPITLKKLVEVRGNEIKAIIFLPHYLIFGSLFLMLRYYFISYGIKFVFSVAQRRLIKFIMNSFFNREPSLNYYIKKFSIPMYNIKRINNKILEKINEISPDLIISLSATEVFNERLLSLPSKGCINLHSGPLPNYRGLFPTFWQLLNGEKEIGVTVHFMNEDIDGGNILLQEKIEISPSDSLSSLLNRVKTTGAQILLKALEIIESNNIITIPNEITNGSYYGLPKRKDIKAFLNKGKKFF